MSSTLRATQERALLSIEASRNEVLLGEAPELALSFQAERDEAAAPLFNHPSLTIALEHPGAADRGWPRYWFPNCWSVERHLPGGDHALDRCSTGARRRPVREGERHARTLALEGSVLAVPVLDVGEFRARFELTAASGEEIRPATPASFRVLSSPAVVPLLIERLASEDFATRHRASALLRRMTACEPGFDPLAEPPSQARAIEAWRALWRDELSGLPWRLDADGATFHPEPAPDLPRAGPAAARGLTGPRLGGVVRRRDSFEPRARRDLIAVLQKWLSAPTRRPLLHLPGELAIADDLRYFPAGGAVLATDPALVQMLGAVVERIANEAPDWVERSGDALKVIGTLRRLPAPELLPSLRELERAVTPPGPYDPVRRAVGEMLDWLDPERVTVGR